MEQISNKGHGSGQTVVRVEEYRPMGGRHAGVTLSILTGARGSFVELNDQEALELVAALTACVQEAR